MFVFVRYPALFWVPLVLTLLAAGWGPDPRSPL